MVLAVNHTSYLDALVLLSILDYRGYAFVAKREFQDNFLMRALLSGFGTQFIERFDIAKSTEHAGELAQAAKAGASLIVFPEGTLTRNTGLMAFRTGAFQAAAQAGIPVVPVALRGIRSAMRDGTWVLRRAAVSVVVGAPVPPEGTRLGRGREAARCRARRDPAPLRRAGPGDRENGVGAGFRLRRWITCCSSRCISSARS